MFGYVRPATSELKVREYDFYRSVYCGLCRRMGKVCGATSRLCLSYDLTFLAMLLIKLRGEEIKTGRRTCAVNCAKPVRAVEDSESLDYAAAVCGVLSDFGFADDAADEKGGRRFSAKCARVVSSGWSKKAGRRYPRLVAGTAERLKALSEAESSLAAGDPDASVDSAASAFGEVLSFIFAYPFGGEDGDERGKRAVAAAVGQRTGRWIYLVDAVDDLAEDGKKGRFNPFAASYGKYELDGDEKITVRCLLAAEAGAAADALMLADDPGETHPEPAAVLNNILSDGMRQVAQRVLDGNYRKPGRDRI